MLNLLNNYNKLLLKWRLVNEVVLYGVQNIGKTIINNINKVLD